MMQEMCGYAQATAAGLCNNNPAYLKRATRYTFVSYYRLRECGAQTFRLWYSNRLDSTGNGIAETPGGTFLIERAYLADGGITPDGTYTREVALTFDGEPSKTVAPGEAFWSDDRSFTLEEGHFLAIVFQVSTAEERCMLPCTHESETSGYQNGVFEPSVLRPNFLGYRREVRRRVVFMGDSVTQGVRTRMDAYESWVPRFAAQIPPENSVWNIGLGWSRAYDAELDGAFLAKAKTADVLFLCFGVNDLKSAGRSAEQIITSLRVALYHLRHCGHPMEIILMTIPPFDLEPRQETERRLVNEWILSQKESDTTFDMAAILANPQDPRLMNEAYKSAPTDCHPNGLGGAAVAAALLEDWRLRHGS